MLPDMGPHAAFIWASYAIEAAVVGALIGWLVLDGRRQSSSLAALDARGRGPQAGDAP